MSTSTVRPNWKNQALMAASLFVLGSFAYWMEYKHKPAKEASEEQTKKLFVLKDKALTSIRVTEGTKVVDLHCLDGAAKLCKPGDNSKWELLEPRKLKADDSNANALVSALNNLTASESIDLKEESSEKRKNLLKEYGLDVATRSASGAKRITATTADGSVTLFLGLNHPIGESIFALLDKGPAGSKPGDHVDENRVYLVPTFFKSNWDHDLSYWRDKKLLTFTSHEVQSFELAGTKTKLKAERTDGKWQLHSGGEEFPGDIENVDNLLSSATYLAAKSFAAESKTDAKGRAALSGARAVVHFTVQLEKGTQASLPPPVTVTLFEKGKDKTKKLLATVSSLDPVYELEPFMKERLDKSLKDLRLAKLITSMDRFTAKRLEASGKPLGVTLILVNKDGKWQSEDGKTEISHDKANTLLDRLSGNRIREFLTGSAIPAGEAGGLKIALIDEKGAKLRELSFWSVGDKLYGRDLGAQRKEAFLLDVSIKEELPWSKDHFLKKTDPGKK